MLLGSLTIRCCSFEGVKERKQPVPWSLELSSFQVIPHPMPIFASKHEAIMQIRWFRGSGSTTVGNFEAVKAFKFNKLQPLSNSGRQKFQQQSPRNNKFQWTSIRAGIWSAGGLSALAPMNSFPIRRGCTRHTTKRFGEVALIGKTVL